MPRIAILLALYNGAEHLPAQIDSLLAQDETDWALVVSDDGSTDTGPDIVRRYAEMRPAGQITLIQGPMKGASANFLHLLSRIPKQVSMAALCDQDDVWLTDKLSRGAAALTALPPGTPGLACARTWVCDEGLAHRKLSTMPPRAPGFRHALVQNIASGNTMMLNRAALDLVISALPEAEGVTHHDWWIYQLISGAGGTVLVDPQPSLLYRQHGGNIVGSGHGPKGIWPRVHRVLMGDYRQAMDQHLAALNRSADRLTGENQRLLAAYTQTRTRPLVRRMKELRQLGLYRQGRTGNLGLLIAALMGRI